MKRVFVVLGIFVVFNSLLYSITFTDEFFNMDNIYSTRMYFNSDSNRMEIGYPNVDGGNTWNNEWGNFSYYNGYFYIVWTDQRYSGENQIFLTKIDTNGNIIFSTNVEISMSGITNSNYSDFARIPTISVYDQNNIYVSFLQYKNGSYATYTTKWQDTGTSLSLVWSKRVDNGFGDLVSATPIPFKLSSTVGAYGELYLLQVWNRVGSGETSYISKILPDGTQYWLSSGLPGTQFLTVFNSGIFIIAGEVLYLNGYVYVTGQHWIWSPNRDFGVGINKISTNDTYSASWGTGTNITYDRGTIYNITRGYAPKVSLTHYNGYLYVAYADQRNGNMDIFLAKVNTNDGSKVFNSTIVSSVYDDQYPMVSYDSLGNIYVSYVDTSTGIPILKLAKVDKDTGSVLGVMDFNSALYSGTTYGFYLPKFFIDDSGKIYIFFKEDGGSGRIRVKVAKYDGFAGNLLWVREFPEIQYKKYTYLYSRRILSDFVGTPVSVILNSVYNGSPIFKVSPNGGLTFYVSNTNTMIVFTNVGSDLRVRIEFSGDGNTLNWIDSYTIDVVDYYSGDIFSSTNSSFSTSVGSNFISSYPYLQVITNITFSDGVSKAIYYFRLHNTGTTNGTFYSYLTPSGWPISVFDWDNNDVSTQFTNGTYSISIPPGGYTNFRLEVSIPSSANDRESQDFVLYSSAIQGGALHDTITFRTISWKYLPDASISNSYGVLGTNIYEITPSVQIYSNIANSRFYGYETPITNYIVLKNNGILADVVQITNNFYVTSGNLSDWNITISNLSDNQLVSSYPYYVNINTGQAKVLQVIVSPKTNAIVGSYLNLEFFTFSTNTYYTILGDTNVYYDDLRKDSVKFVYENHKVQPDLVVSTNLYFIGSVGEGNYVYTNSSVTQSIMVRTVNNVGLTYYFKLRNDGLETDTIYLKSYGITNSGWSEVYYVSSSNITAHITNGTNLTLSPGEEFVFRGVFTPDSSVASGVEPWVKVIAYSLKLTNISDIVYARPRNIKVRPDAIIGESLSSLLGDNVYNSSGLNQCISNILRKGGVEVATNFVIVQNDSTTDPDILNIVGSSGSGNWFVKYLDISDNDITYNITNGTNLTLPLASSVTLKVVSYPQNSSSDDEFFEIKVRTYSSYVASQEDVVIISNRAVSIKPDIGVFSFSSGWIDLPILASSYEEQGSFSNKIIAGFTNHVKVRLKNDTSSVQDYIFKANISNTGGSLSDWDYIFKSVVGSVTNDITFYVTNNGWTNTYLANQSIEILIYVMLTNAVESDISTTNGAVSNYFKINYDFVSVFRTNITDKGMHSFIVTRGLPDAYHESSSVGRDIVTNDFYNGNYLVYGVTKNYPREDIILRFKNLGDYRDTFRIFATVSNGTGDIDNWIYTFYDEQTNDITYYVTNTNAGWTNVITNGYERLIRMIVVNSNGFVNDNVFFRFYFETLTKEKRLDTIWYEVIITPGLPDVAMSNLITGEMKGTNQFAPDSSDYLKLESGEKGRYRIVLRNIAPIVGEPTFKLKATVFGDVSKFDIYHTNKQGVSIDISDLTTVGYTNALSNYSAANGWPEDYLSLLIIPKTTVSSGDKIIIRYDFSLYDNPGVYDTIFITNQFVVPNVKVLSIPSYSSNIVAYVGKYQSSYGLFIISNADVVTEKFLVKFNQSSPSGWSLKFFTNSTDVTSLMSSGFWTENVDGNGIYLMSFEITNMSELVSGTTNTVSIIARPKKNTNISHTLKVDVVYVDAIADIFARNNDDDTNTIAGFGIIDGALTNKIEINETNTYLVYLSNSISSGSKVRFRVSVESNFSPETLTFVKDSANNDITSLVFNSNYIVELASGESTFIKVFRVLTNTNSLVSRGFYSYLKLSMKTVDVENSIYDYIVLKDVVVDPEVDIRSASGYDAVWSFSSYSDTGKNLKTFKSTPVTIYLGIMNKDLVKEKFGIRAKGGNNIWAVKYYDLNNNDITESIVNGSYLTPYVDGGNFYIIKCVITPSVEVNPADVFVQDIQTWSYKNNTRRDFVTNTVSIESMFIVGSVKDKKTKQPIRNPIIEVVDPYGIKVSVTGDTNGYYSAPVYPVIGGLYNIKVDASGYVGSITNIYLEIGTNVVDVELVGLNMSSDNTDIRIFPNPIKSGSGGSFVFALKEPSKVTVSIYDLKGKLVKHLVRDEEKQKGVYYVLWDGTDENGTYVKQGVYVFTINTAKEVIVKKLFVR